MRKISTSAEFFQKEYGSTLFQRGLTQVYRHHTLDSVTLKRWTILTLALKKLICITIISHHIRLERQDRCEPTADLVMEPLQTIMPVLPGISYVLRVVSEVLSSNGSYQLFAVVHSHY